MMETRKVPFWTNTSQILIRWVLRKHLAHVYLRAPTTLRDNVPIMLCANHGSGYDAPLALFMVETYLGLDAYMMTLSSVIRAYPFVRKFGLFEADNSTPLNAARTVKYTASLLNAEGDRCIIVFPQGRYTRSHKRPLGFQPGVAQIVRLAKQATIVPVALYVENFIERLPEAFISIGSPITDIPFTTTNEILSVIERSVTFELDRLQLDVANNRLDEFQVILDEQNGLLSWLSKKLILRGRG